MATTRQAKNRSPIFARILFYAICAVVIFYINIWIKNALDKSVESSVESSKTHSQTALNKDSQVLPQKKSSSTSLLKKQSLISQQEELKHIKGFKEATQEGIIKRVRVQRGGDYTEGFFYRGDEEFAREKSTAQGKIEQYGKIPDGKVILVDENNNVYGEEYYRWGKRDGASKTYCSDGTLSVESLYELGELKTQKEYYRDGKLRLEVDYRDARKGDREVGIGKLYYRNGVLKYEWHLTNSDARGFKKSYNTDGSLRAETYYDADGKMIKDNKY